MGQPATCMRAPTRASFELCNMMYIRRWEDRPGNLQIQIQGVKAWLFPHSPRSSWAMLKAPDSLKSSLGGRARESVA